MVANPSACYNENMRSPSALPLHATPTGQTMLWAEAIVRAIENAEDLAPLCRQISATEWIPLTQHFATRKAYAVLHAALTAAEPLPVSTVKKLTQWCKDWSELGPRQHLDMLDAAIIILLAHPKAPLEHPTIAHRWWLHLNTTPRLPRLHTAATSIITASGTNALHVRMPLAVWSSRDPVCGDWLHDALTINDVQCIAHMPLGTAWAQGPSTHEIESPIKYALTSPAQAASIPAIKNAWPAGLYYAFDGWLSRFTLPPGVLKNAPSWAPHIDELTTSRLIQLLKSSSSDIPPSLQERHAEVLAHRQNTRITRAVDADTAHSLTASRAKKM